MLAEFPAHEVETPATKDFVRAEIGILRTEMHHEIGLLRTEMHEEIGLLRTEMHEEIGSLRTALVEMELRLSEKLRLQMIWLTGLVVAALGLMRALGG